MPSISVKMKTLSILRIFSYSWYSFQKKKIKILLKYEKIKIIIYLKQLFCLQLWIINLY